MLPLFLWIILMWIYLYFWGYLNRQVYDPTIINISNTWAVSNTWWIEQPKLSISWDCSINNTRYKVLEIFGDSNALQTPSNKELENFTRRIKVKWDIEELYICVISDIREDYKKYKAYRFSTYLFMWNSKNAGNINVWYSLRNWVVYDGESWWPSYLNGIFWWNEAPYTQVVNLANVTIADTVEWWSKTISPIKLFDDGATILIGWFVNTYPNRRAWKITKLHIIYKWWEISL